MSEREVDELFERWRKCRDVDALGLIFDRTSPELWKLAISLAPTSADAEDALQATYLAAIERAASFDARQRLTPWLAGILVRQIGLVRRVRSRFVEPERVDERREREPHEFAFDAETRAELERALASFKLADRELLRAAIFDEKKPADIARESGRTPGAVRMQLHRGLERLRKALPPSFALGAAWISLHGRGLAAVRAAVLEEAACAPIVGAATAVTIGGIVVSTKFVISSVAAVAVAALAWLMWPHSETAQPTPTLLRVADRTTTLAAPVSAPVANTIDTSREPVASTPSVDVTAKVETPKHRWIVRGHVSGAPAGRETETKLAASFFGKFNIPRTVEGFASRDGSFELDVTDVVEEWMRNATPTELSLVAEHPICLRADQRTPFSDAHVVADAATGARTEFVCDVALSSAAVVSGRVILPADWKPIESELREIGKPSVGLFEFAGAEPNGEPNTDLAACGLDGRWTMRASHGGDFTIIALADGLRPTTVHANLVLGRVTELDPLVLDRGASISGFVKRAGGSVGGGAFVRAQLKESSRGSITLAVAFGNRSRLLLKDGVFERVDAEVVTADDGSYRLEGLASREYGVWVNSAPGRHSGVGGRTRYERVVTAPAQRVDLEAVPPLIHLAFTVNGNPPRPGEFDHVVVDLIPRSSDEREANYNLEGWERDPFLVQVIGGVAYDLRVQAGRYIASTTAIAALDSGEQRDVLVDLKPADASSEIVVKFIVDESEKLGGVRFGLNDPQIDRYERVRWITAEASDDGSFHLRDLGAGRYRLQIRPDDVQPNGTPSHSVPTEFEIEVPAKSVVKREVELEFGARIRMSAKDENSGFVRAAVALIDGRGEKIPTDFYCNTQGTNYGCGWYLCEQGLNDHPPLPPGHYEFTLSAEGFEKEVVKLDLLAGETRTLEVTMHKR